MSNTELLRTTKQMIDGLKSVCTTFGLGNASAEYKIITEVFLYKFINDRFFFEASKAYEGVPTDALADKLSELNENDYTTLTLAFPASVAILKPGQYLSDLYNQRNRDDIATIFDATLKSISDDNLEVFSVRTGSDEKIELFESITKYVTESNRRADFVRAILDRIVNFSFHDAFKEKYDFFASIFEYLVKDYNKDFGKYAEYYTPHSVATIIARVLAPQRDENVTIYDPSAGSGTLALALAHQIGEDNCTIFTQDISQKSNEFLRLNLILNNLVHSLPNVIHGDTLLTPMHRDGSQVKKFDYITSNPPFKTDFSDTRDVLAGDLYKERFWAGVPKIPANKKERMEIYLLFLQHIIHSLKPNGKAAIVIPTGFLTANTGIPKKIRKEIIEQNMLRGVISMPSNIFATTSTNVSVVILDKANTSDSPIILLDASKLGTKTKVDGTNQRTVLSDAEIEKIISTFNTCEEIEDFSVVVTADKIKKKNYSFSAAQYFDIKIDHIDITPEEFSQRMKSHMEALTALNQEANELQEKIMEQLKRVTL